MFRRIGIVFLMALLMAACAQQGVDEARCVVAEADSLWQAGLQYGIDEGDSATLAQAYKTLEAIPLPFREGLGLGSPYAHACYHYGRLLRRADDPVAAMQVFISGTHSGTKDYHILGRIYSNMGTMCHLADEFELGYDMYKMSAEFFRKAGDTTLYYYQHNAMALELAEQKLHDETLSVLGKIETECTDTNVLTKTWETKAILYKNLVQYDSAIYAAHQLYAHGYRATSGYVTMAQAFWHLEQFDSAVCYAKQVIDNPYAVEQDVYNMLYLVAYCDSAISKDAMQEHYQARTDIDKEILDPLHIQLAQAIDVLLQDRDKKPYYISIGILFIVVCILAMTSRIAVLRIKRHRKQSIETIEAKFSELQHDISEQRQKLYAETRYEQQKQFGLQQQQQQLFAEHLAIIEQNCIAIRSSNNISAALCWKDFDQMCRYIYDAFFMFVTKLTAVGKFNEYEVRLCVLVLLDFDYETISHILKRAKNGIGKAKYRVAQKLGTTTGNLRQVLINLAIDAPKKDI